MTLIVQKFGGTSVGSIERMHIVADHIAQTASSGKRLVVVVSAMGDETDRLQDMATQLCKTPPRREMDMLMSTGERVSMALLSIALHTRNIRSVSYTGSQSGILTDDTHGNARIKRILGDRIRQSLDKGNVVIVAGFQGMSLESKEITTLGRGGSDLTAVALAHALHADTCEIYTDVDGVCSADPRIVRSARVLTKIAWPIMSEMAWQGAGVVHARAAHLAHKSKIPLVLRSSFKFNHPGTRIEGETSMESPEVVAVTHKSDMSLVTVHYMAPSRTSAVSLRWHWEKGMTPGLTQWRMLPGDRIEWQLLMPTSSVEPFREALQKDEHVRELKLTSEDQLSAISVIGSGFWQSPEMLEKAVACAGDQLRFLDSRNMCLTLCVKGGSEGRIVNAIHAEFIK